MGARLSWTARRDPASIFTRSVKILIVNGSVIMDLNSPPFLPSMNSGPALSPSKYSAQSFKNSPRPWLISKAVFGLLLCAVTTLAEPRSLIAQEQILVGYDGHAGFQGAIWATKDLGLFEKHGLAGELILIPGPRRWRRSYAAAMWRWSPRRIINCR